MALIFFKKTLLLTIFAYLSVSVQLDKVNDDVGPSGEEHSLVPSVEAGAIRGQVAWVAEPNKLGVWVANRVYMEPEKTK